MEVLLATFLVGLMMTLVWGGFAQSFDAKADLERQIDAYDNVRMAMARITRDLSMAYLSKNFAAAGERRTKTVFVGKADRPIARLNFASFAHVRLFKNSHESDQTEITYFGARELYSRQKASREREKRRGGPEVWNLMRRESRRIDEDPERGGSAQVVAEGIRKLELHYWDPKDCKEDCWKDVWDTESADGQLDRLPDRVKVSVTIIDENGRDLTLQTQAKVMMNKEAIKF